MAKKKEDLMRGPKLDEKPKLKKTAPYGGKGEYTLAKEMMKKQADKKKASYSPAPMSAAAKAKAAARGKATAAKTKPSTLSKVGKTLAKTPAGKAVSRAKTVAREVRDIPTAAANVIKSRNLPQGGVAKFAKKDLKAQIKEVGTAIKSGKKGTQAAQETTKSSMKGRVGGGGLDYYISKPKNKRK